MEKKEKIVLIYAGQRLGAKNKIIHSYKLKSEERFIQFSKKISKIEIIGDVIECLDKGNGSYCDFKITSKIEIGNKKYGNLDNWFALQRAAMEFVKQVRVNKQKRPESLEQKVENIKQQLKGLSTTNKQNIALWIYTQLLK